MSFSDLTLLDGGMGRELLRIGAPFRQPEWSALALLEGPQYVRQVHDSYVAAGADVITTNSYAIVPYHIGEERFAARGTELADLAGRLGREAVSAAADRGVRLAGSIPPVFGSYRPDRFQAEEAQRLLRPLVAGLAPHIDLWLAETQGSLAEAAAARVAIGLDHPLPFWLSFTLSDDRPGAVAEGRLAPSLRSGESIPEAAAAALKLQASALLFNCSHAGVMEAALRQAAAAFQALPPAQRPRLGVYANAFAPHEHKSEANQGLSALRQDLEPQDYLAFARRWQEAGADIIGGCCGIGPDYIAELARARRG